MVSTIKHLLQVTEDTTNHLSATHRVQNFIYQSEGCLVDVAGLNPNCSSAKMLLTLICCRSFSYMIFLEIEVN
jgi:hypothetical protein